MSYKLIFSFYLKNLLRITIKILSKIEMKIIFNILITFGCFISNVIIKTDKNKNKINI